MRSESYSLGLELKMNPMSPGTIATGFLISLEKRFAKLMNKRKIRHFAQKSAGITHSMW
jgi:hypothetical protein